MVKDCKEDPECNVGFPQPGYEAGYKRFADQKEKGCGDMVSRLWGDNPMVEATHFEYRFEICNNHRGQFLTYYQKYN